MPRRRGHRKLSAAKVRAIFKSVGPVAKVATGYGVSQALVYQIQSRRIHRETTKSIPAPRRTGRRRRRSTLSARVATVRIDLDRLADKIIKRLVARFRARG